MKARHGDLSDQEKNRIRDNLSTIYQKFVGKKEFENQQNPQTNAEEPTQNADSSSENKEGLRLDKSNKENELNEEYPIPVLPDESEKTVDSKERMEELLSSSTGLQAELSSKNDLSLDLSDAEHKKDFGESLNQLPLEQGSKPQDNLRDSSNKHPENEEIEYLTNWNSMDKGDISFGESTHDSTVYQNEKLWESGSKTKDSALLTSIYDRILRIFFYYKREWLAVVENSIFYGIVTKRNTMTQLAEINDSSLPKINLTAKDIILPTVAEALEQMSKQDNFLQINRQGDVLDTLSRPAFLALVEKIVEYQQPISLLEINDLVNDPDNQRKTDMEAGSTEEPAEVRVHSYNNDIDWLMSMILESLPMELAAVDMNGRILFFNDHFKNYLRKMDSDPLQSADKFEAEVRKSIRRVVSGNKFKAKNESTVNAKKKSFVAEFHFGGKKSKWNFNPLFHYQSLMGYALRKIP